ncbi:MAG: heavy metal translocating P-type ATPase [Sulfolobales archaeon]|nr:heavy metal translocating P-type ATPase [Sulfolobales archaeon]MDW8082561.1 heavy metal translocating P-type ATPase [Sulfolobales archaeon]
MTSSTRSERLRVLGVDCPTCVYSIQRNLEKLAGVRDFRVDVSSGDAVVVYEFYRVTLRDIFKAIREAGYDVEKERLYAAVDLEDSEIPLFEKYVSELPGVFECRYSPISKVSSILFNPLTTSRSSLLSEIGRRYPEVSELADEVELVVEERSDVLLTKVTSFSLGLAAVAYYTMGALGIHPPLWSRAPYILLPIATAVIVLNLDILSKGLKSLIRRTPTMDSLISLSSLTTYIYSIIALLFLTHGETFFEVSAGVLGFVSLGKYLEEKLRYRSSRALKKLAELAVGTARVVDSSGVVREISTSQVKPGDLVEVKAGERFPVDGVVVGGVGYVDESMFTGEPVPREKSEERRDPVLAGSLLVNGYLVIRATRVGEDTVLAYIVKTVRESQFYKPGVQKIADIAVGYLTWVVIALSIVTFTYWFLLEGVGLDRALLFTVSVLAITCPCPLGIAIPMVISLASIKAVQLGVLMRRGDVLERILKVDRVLLDKTGTLTVGSPEVVDVVLLDSSRDLREVLEYACSIERMSEHPIAKAIVKYCSKVGVDYRESADYVAIPGMGVVAKVDGVEAAVGSLKLVESISGNTLDEVRLIVDRISSKGRTAVVVVVGRKPAAIFEVGDRLRNESRSFIEHLNSIGVEAVLATGDTSRSAETIASELGIEKFYAELRPEDKAELVESLQSSGSRVMFIGDGINDAAAIGRAFIGIAMGRGSDISKESGDVVVMSDNLLSVIDLFKLARKSRRKSLENLAWAFIYNLLLIPIAMGALYKSTGIILRPEAAAIAMILSDISVVLNSLTLLKWSPK